MAPGREGSRKSCCTTNSKRETGKRGSVGHEGASLSSVEGKKGKKPEEMGRTEKEACTWLKGRGRGARGSSNTDPLYN